MGDITFIAFLSCSKIPYSQHTKDCPSCKCREKKRRGWEKEKKKKRKEKKRKERKKTKKKKEKKKLLTLPLDHQHQESPPSRYDNRHLEEVYTPSFPIPLSLSLSLSLSFSLFSSSPHFSHTPLSRYDGRHGLGICLALKDTIFDVTFVSPPPLFFFIIITIF